MAGRRAAGSSDAVGRDRAARTEDVLGTQFDQIIEIWADLPDCQARLGARGIVMMVHTVH